MIAIITTMLALAGFAFNIADKVYSINDKLDRNCVYLKQISDAQQFFLATQSPKTALPPIREISC